MPLKIQENKITGFRPGFLPEEEQLEPFALRFAKALPDAAMEMNSPVAAGAAITEAIFDPPIHEPFDHDYEVYNDPSVMPFIEMGYGSEFADVRNQTEAMQRIDHLSSRVERLKRLESAGGAGVLAEFTMGALDPIAAFGFLGGAGKALNTLRKAKGVSMATKMGAGALEVGLGGASGVAMAEAVRQASLPGLGWEESAWNIGGAALLGGVFGAGLPVATKALGMSADQLAKIVDAELTGMDVAPTGSVGAMAVPQTTLKQETLTSALGIEKLTAFISPIQRMMTSPSLNVRKYAQELVSNPLQTEKGKEGIAPSIPVEFEIEKWQKPLGIAKDKTHQLFVKHRSGTEGGRVKQLGITMWDTLGRGMTRPDGKLTMKEFLEEVGEAMANGDIHPIAEVAEAAQHWRKTLFNPILESGIKANLWPEDLRNLPPATAQSYITRIYNVPKIMAEENAFHQAIYKHYLDERNVSKRELETLRAEMEAVEEKAVAASEPDLLTPKEVKPKRNPLANLKRSPQTLRGFIRKAGGMRDERGDLRNMDLRKNKKFKGVVNSKGVAPDDMLRMAQEAGFFPEGPANAPETLTVNDLYALIEKEAGGQDVFSRFSQSRADEAFERQKAELESDLQREKLDNTKALAEEAGFKLDDIDAAEVTRLTDQGIDLQTALDDTIERRAIMEEQNIRRELDEVSSFDDDIPFDDGPNKAPRADQQPDGAGGQGRRSSGEKAGSAKADNKPDANSEKKSRLDELEYRANFTDEQLDMIARETIQRIKGLPDGQLPYILTDDVPGRVNPKGAKSGVFKARSLMIQDELIKPWLVRNIFDVADIYTRRAVPDIELTLRFGDMDLTEAKQLIANEYGDLKAGIKDGKEMDKLNRRMEEDIRDIAAMRDRLRNNYGLPQDPTHWAVRTSQVMRGTNLLTKMGDVVRSSLSDIARPIMTQGLTNVVKHGITPFIRDFKGARLNMKESGLIGAVMEMSNNTRLSRAGDVADMYAGRTALERTVRAGTDTFGLVSGMSLWNQMMKEWVCMIARSRILEDSVKLKAGKLKSKGKARLAESFISEKMARQIADMAEEVDGVWLFKDDAMEDPDIARTISAALWREANSAIVTPGAGQLPLWVSSEAGRFFWQFRSFMLAAHQSVAISGLQRRDRATMWGAVASAAIGSAVYALKTTASGREVSDNPATWIAEGIDRSGIISLFFEINNTLEKVSGNQVGIRPMLGASPSSRFASRGKLESMAGPNVGMAADILATADDTISGEFDAGTVRRIRRTVIPYQNFFMFRGPLNQAEKGVNQFFGLE